MDNHAQTTIISMPRMCYKGTRRITAGDKYAPGGANAGLYVAPFNIDADPMIDFPMLEVVPLDLDADIGFSFEDMSQ